MVYVINLRLGTRDWTAFFAPKRTMHWELELKATSEIGKLEGNTEKHRELKLSN